MPKALTDLISIETLDTDGALREQAAAVEGTTRAGLFRKAGIAGGAMVAGGVLFGGMPALAGAAPSRAQDTEILNYALTLEYLEAAFYKEAVKSNFDGVVGQFAKLVAADEKAHVEYLKRALGSSAVRSPKFDFGNSTSDQRTFVATAFALENTGVEAYAGQATRIKQAAVVKAAVSVLTVEARHAAAIAVIAGNLTGKNGITPDGPFDKPASMAQVLKIVRGTGFITG